MNESLGKLFAFFQKNALIFYAGIGMGIYRCAHEWPLWFNATVTQVGVSPLFVGDFFFLLHVALLYTARPACITAAAQ